MNFCLAHPGDADRCVAPERTADEGDEAATLGTISTRIAAAPPTACSWSSSTGS